MGAFEFETPVQLNARNCHDAPQNPCGCRPPQNSCNNNDRGEVSIIAQKIFDQCRIQKCLTANVLGPARSAKCHNPNHEHQSDGDIIIPPANATDVTLRDLQLRNIEILRKKPSPLQDGCWDIDLKYIFDYILEFRRMDGSIICAVEATNSYILKVTLFGSTQGDVTIVSDANCDCTTQLGGKPYVFAEGKAIGLSAELKYPNCGCGGHGHHDGAIGVPVAVDVAIGLFTIVKLYRYVNVIVESLGSVLPEECTTNCNSSNTSPCANFDNIPFPLDLFKPSNETKSCCGYGGVYGSDQNCGNGGGCGGNGGGGGGNCSCTCTCDCDCDHDSDSSCGCNHHKPRY